VGVNTDVMAFAILDKVEGGSATGVTDAATGCGFCTN